MGDKSMEKLAEAMNKLADRLEKFQDPLVWQRLVADGLAAIPALAQIMPQMGQLPPGVTVGSVAVSVSLSDEERTKLSNQVYEAIKPQIEEFNQFVQESLLEMPAYRLKEMAEKIEAGAKPRIERRHGCIFIGLDSGEEYYLPL